VEILRFDQGDRCGVCTKKEPFNQLPNMYDLTDSALVGLLLLINRLSQSDRPLGRATIVPFAEIKLPQVAQHYDELVT
jgi:hypothetical protein